MNLVPMWIKAVVILLFTFFQTGYSSNLEALGDEDYHLRILEALKRMNHRLVRIEIDKLVALQSVQENLHRQIEEIRDSLQQIQATGEINKSEMLASVSAVTTKVLDIEGHLRNEVMAEFDKQKHEQKTFLVKLSSLLGQLKNGLATDMESFSKANEQNFTVFSEGNKEKLQQIVDALSDQTENLKQTQALFKTDLIPALDAQNEATRQTIMGELNQSRLQQKGIIEANQKQVIASLAAMIASLAMMDEKNKTLISVLKQSIAVDEEIKALTKIVQENIGVTNQNINRVQDNLGVTNQNINRVQDNLGVTNQNIDQARQMIGTLNQELSEVRANQMAVAPQLETLSGLSKQIGEQSVQIQRDIKESVKLLGSSETQTNMANEKLTKLIDILKAIVVEQEKIDKVIQSQEKLDVVLQAQGKVDQAMQGQAQGKIDQILQGQGKIDQILQGMDKLDLLLQVQGKLDQALQGQGLSSITSQETISHMQQEIKNALADLRRKANVNISRNDDILKKIKK